MTPDPYAALAELIDAASRYVAPRRTTDARQVLLGKLDAARAALAQRAEPVAYRYKTKRSAESEGSVWHLISHPDQRDALSASYGAIAHPLYAAPPPAPPPPSRPPTAAENAVLQEQPSGDAWSDGYEEGYKAGLAEHAAPPAPQDAQPEPVSAADELAQLEPLIARSRALYDEWAKAVERLRGQS